MRLTGSRWSNLPRSNSCPKSESRRFPAGINPTASESWPARPALRGGALHVSTARPDNPQADITSSLRRWPDLHLISSMRDGCSLTIWDMTSIIFPPIADIICEMIKWSMTVGLGRIGRLTRRAAIWPDANPRKMRRARRNAPPSSARPSLCHAARTEAAARGWLAPYPPDQQSGS